MVQPWMSFGTSPSPRPLSGSLLVALSRIAPAEPDAPPSTENVVVTSTSLWFGGQRAPGLAEQATAGGVASIFSDAEPPPELPATSAAVHATSCVPSPETESGACALGVPRPSTAPAAAPVHVSAAIPFASSPDALPATGELTNQPFLPSGAGNVTWTTGAVVSIFADDAPVPVFPAASVAVQPMSWAPSPATLSEA